MNHEENIKSILSDKLKINFEKIESRQDCDNFLNHLSSTLRKIGLIMELTGDFWNEYEMTMNPQNALSLILSRVFTNKEFKNYLNEYSCEMNSNKEKFNISKPNRKPVKVVQKYSDYKKTFKK